MPSLHRIIADTLQHHGISLHASLGQHFLIDEAVLRSIVSCAALTPRDTVFEIGPGIGILTKELLRHAGRVTAVELDARMVPLLRAYVGDAPTLTLVHGDALRAPLPEMPYRVVSNIPYQITAPLLKRLLEDDHDRPQSLTLLVQREVAEKIMAKDGGNRLSVFVRCFAEAALIRHVPPGAFLPPPQVVSSVIHLRCLPKPMVEGAVQQRLFALAHTAFAGKRKMLRTTIGKLPDGSAALQRAGIDPTARPETLSMEAWCVLARSMEGWNGTVRGAER